MNRHMTGNNDKPSDAVHLNVLASVCAVILVFDKWSFLCGSNLIALCHLYFKTTLRNTCEALAHTPLAAIKHKKTT